MEVRILSKIIILTIASSVIYGQDIVMDQAQADKVGDEPYYCCRCKSFSHLQTYVIIVYIKYIFNNSRFCLFQLKHALKRTYMYKDYTKKNPQIPGYL